MYSLWNKFIQPFTLDGIRANETLILFSFPFGRFLLLLFFFFILFSTMSVFQATNGETVNVSNPNTIINVNMTNVTKLTSTNYIMWSRQVHVLFDGYNLAGYLDGSVLTPPPTLSNEGTSETNPEFLIWKRQDRLIYSAILGAISASLLPLLSTAQTAHQIWTTLSSTYAKPSRAHFKQLRQQFKH